jgi:glucose/arabinose dehydrogenase
MRSTRFVTLAALAAACTVPAAAQQKVPFRNNIPIAPSGIAIPPLPDAPVIYHTAEGQDIRVVVYARGLKHPWSQTWLPDGTLLVTERNGAVRAIRNGTLDPNPVGAPAGVRTGGTAGLMDIAPHPKFADNGWIYLTYTKAVDDKMVLALARGRWDGKAIAGLEEIFVAGEGTSETARIVFGRDGFLYMTSGGNDDTTQDPHTHAGKVLRLTDAGKPAPGNPFADGKNGAPEVFTLGHRNGMGIAVHPGTGKIWENENGPNGGDEVNVLEAGGNYGWPLVSLGRTYPGPWQSKGFSREGMIDPIVYWTPSIAISGMAFYTGDKLPKWKGDLFVGGLRMGEIPGTGHLERVLFNENMEELRREMLLVDLRQRIRDVKQGPDELLYLLTDDDNGAVLRIEPAQ